MKAFLLTVLTLASAQVFAEPQAYPFYCRGPLKLVYYPNLLAMGVRFDSNPMGAGKNGANLRPGTCAWEDRAVNANEPKEFLVILNKNIANINDQTKANANFNAITQITTSAMKDANTVLLSNAYNLTGFIQRADESALQVLPFVK